jgi:transcriptional regulator with XRE-family HTH domain
MGEGGGRIVEWTPVIGQDCRANYQASSVERGLTQELAARIRLNRNCVGMIEQMNSPTVAIVERIAKALGIKAAWLSIRRPRAEDAAAGSIARLLNNDLPPQFLFYWNWFLMAPG